MKISIFGLGYVGCVSAACFAKQGIDVVGVDLNQTKIDMISDGQTPIVEKDLQDLISTAVRENKLSATSDPDEAVLGSEMSLVCVGTPSLPNGDLDDVYAERVSKNIGIALQKKDDYHVVVYRSTLLPGVVEGKLIPLLEKYSGKKAGMDFGVGVNPEFLRESTAVYDFFNPPKTVIGALSEVDIEKIAMLYQGIEAPMVKTTIPVAGLVKYADNIFHALKVVFGNEIGTICKALGVDSHKVMEIFCLDTKLNLSPYYLKPGFAFGGSCLPKDLRAINYVAKKNDLDLALLPSILESNKKHISNTIQSIMSMGKKKLGFLGLAFKAGTDDLRESPLVEVVEFFIGKGYDIKIFDHSVSLARLCGSNKAYIEDHIPHIAKLLCRDLDEVVDHSEILIIGNKDPLFKEIIYNRQGGKAVFDLVRISDDLPADNPGYSGIAW